MGFDDGQEANQFSELDGKLSLLGLWRWWCLRSAAGALRLESFLTSFKMSAFGQPFTGVKTTLKLRRALEDEVQAGSGLLPSTRDL